jgi:DNA polymerase elongation subunit (family B)
MAGEYKISMEQVELFLHGRDDEKYIVAIEYNSKTNVIYKVIHDPELGKGIRQDLSFEPFCWVKNLAEFKGDFYRYKTDPPNISTHIIQERVRQAKIKHGITMTPLADNGNQRLFEGFKYLVKSSKGMDSLRDFFRSGGLNIWDKTKFITLPPVEQYLIQKGKRMFKGLEEYQDVHRVTFDIETQGLDPKQHKVYAIGVRDNRGFSTRFEAPTTDPTPEEEREIILDTFTVIDAIRPAVIASYNGFDFDWWFLLSRSTALGMDFKDVVTTLSKNNPIKTREYGVTIGADTEDFTLYELWGYNNVDINHATKRAQAIDSDMKNTKLKYVCKYCKIAKKNRVYIQGDQIYKLWSTPDPYYFNDLDGLYIKHKPQIIKQKFITRADIQANPDKIYVFGDNDTREGMGGQAKEMRGEPNSFGIRTKKAPLYDPEVYYTDAEYSDNIKKINEDILRLRNDFVLKGKTIVFPEDGIGTGMAKLKENAPKTFKFLNAVLKYLEDYVNGFEEVSGRYIVGRYLDDDLWETEQVDEVYNQVSFLMTKLVPTTFQKATVMGNSVGWKLLMMEWSYFQGLAIPTKAPKRDYVGGLSRMPAIGFFKNIIKVDYESLYPSEQLVFDMFPDADVTGIMKSFMKYFHSQRFAAKDIEKKNKKTNPQLSLKYKRKQMPLKIFINAGFGSVSAPDQLPWADINIGERITCTARQFLRLAMRFFIARGYIPLMNDTDGINFSAPDSAVNAVYIGKGLHPKVEEGKEYKGVDAHLAEFNDLYLYGEMALAFDGSWESQINASRKNYIVMEYDGKIKLTGNSLKSRTMPTYIEEFFEKALPILMKGDGLEFVHYYTAYVKKIFNKEIPLVKIANKSRVKSTVEEYKSRGLNKDGKALPKQAHMELIIQNNLKVNSGDYIYYVNDGTAVSHGDVKEKYKRDEKGKLLKDADGKAIPDGIYAYMISASDIENNPDLLGNYNVPKFLDAFNNKIEPLLVVFDTKVRDKILLMNPADEQFFTREELELCNNMPDKPSDKDEIEEFFVPDPREYKFWEQFNYNPDIWKDENFKFYVPGYLK